MERMSPIPEQRGALLTLITGSWSVELLARQSAAVAAGVGATVRDLAAQAPPR